jgi:isoquinoline 1-oxidoreductase beta subunit
MTTTLKLSRRDFLRTGAVAGAGLTLAVYLDGCSSRAEHGEAPTGQEPAFLPNAFVRVGKDGSVLVVAKHLEMGQGTYTGLATIVAEELDADWSKVRVIGAPADASKYNNLLWGPAQGTGGSTAMANSWEQLRKAGATARAMLVAAAAKRWGVDPSGLSTEAGVVTDPKSGKRADYGSLATEAAALPVPAEVPLKEPGAFRLIGKTAPRVDAGTKVTGQAVFTQDVRLPGMLTAVVAHPPRFGATVKSFDATAARAVKGVVDVVQIPTGVAVLGEGFWAARQGRDQLKIEWDEGKAFKLGSEEIAAQYRVLATKAGKVARKEGNIDAALARAARVLEASYEVPFLAHACMEPMNCVIQLSPDRVEVWNGEQLHTGDQMALASAAGLKPEQVTINMLYAGGSFGRRANPKSDYVLEAFSVAKASGGKAPVKLVWSREDDMHAGYFRPLTLHTFKGGLDRSGKAVGWRQRIVGQSIIAGTPFEPMLIKDGIDATSVEGAANTRYAVPNLQVELTSPTLPIPVQWWRSVGNTHTAFAVECFIDELAGAAGADPVEFRRALLAEAPRHLGVLNLAAEKAGWSTPLPAGRARGIAVHESFNSYVAEVAEVSIEDGQPRVHRVVCAVDCGVAINPDVVRMQMESGIAYGLSAALYGAITIKDGQVEQGNFDRYRVLRFDEMPVVEVHIVSSDAPPTGVGEPGTPPMAPAVANALFQLTGKRVRKLPLVG